MIVLVANVAVPAPPPDLYCAVNVVSPVTVSRYDALAAKRVLVGVLCIPTAKSSDALCVSPPVAEKLIKPPLLLVLLLH